MISPPFRWRMSVSPVSRAVDAEAGCHIVLTLPGISVIKDAILESRKIFAPLYTLALIAYSESLRLIITVAVLGLAVGAYPLDRSKSARVRTALATKVEDREPPVEDQYQETIYLKLLVRSRGVVNSLLLLSLSRGRMELLRGRRSK